VLNSELEDLIRKQGCHCHVLGGAKVILGAHKQHECHTPAKLFQWRVYFAGQAVAFYARLENIFYVLMFWIFGLRLLKVFRLLYHLLLLVLLEQTTLSVHLGILLIYGILIYGNFDLIVLIARLGWWRLIDGWRRPHLLTLIYAMIMKVKYHASAFGNSLGCWKWTRSCLDKVQLTGSTSTPPSFLRLHSVLWIH
jgi:hypothetical protein